MSTAERRGHSTSVSPPRYCLPAMHRQHAATSDDDVRTVCGARMSPARLPLYCIEEDLTEN